MGFLQVTVGNLDLVLQLMDPPLVDSLIITDGGFKISGASQNDSVDKLHKDILPDLGETQRLTAFEEPLPSGKLFC